MNFAPGRAQQFEESELLKMAILLKTWMNMVVVKMDGIDFEMVLISLCFSRVTVIRGQVVTTSGRGLVGVRITRYQEYQMNSFEVENIYITCVSKCV